MMLLGVLSHVSWSSFLTGLFTIDALVVAAGFVLDKTVWSKDGSQTKNEKRNRRDEDSSSAHPETDYATLSREATTYVKVKSVDDEELGEERISREGNEQVDMASLPGELSMHEYGVEDEEETGLDIPQSALEEEEEVFSDEELRSANEAVMMDYEVLSDDNYDSDVNYLAPEDEEPILSSETEDEQLSGVTVRQGDSESALMYDEDGEIIIDDDECNLLASATPQYLLDVMRDEIPEPELSDEPTFDQ